MGGVWKKIPVTYAMMWIGSLALAGVPFFAGITPRIIMLEAAFADHTWFGQLRSGWGLLRR
jgi:NADH-quinone oxidoreductase subunit L